MAFTTTASNNILNQLTGRTSSTVGLSTCYLALSTTEPSADGTGFTEPDSSTGYARILLGNYNQSATWKMDAPANGSITNGSNILFFPIAISSWGTITYFGLFNAATNGTLMVYGALTTPVSVSANYVPLFNVNNFTLTLS